MCSRFFRRSLFLPSLFVLWSLLNVGTAWAQPNLKITDLRIAPIKIFNTTALNGEYLVSFRMTNDGTSAAGPFRLRLYYSQDFRLSSSDVWLNVEIKRNSLAANSSSGIIAVAVSLSSFSAILRTGYIGGYIDDGNTVQESNETDNKKLLSIPRTASSSRIDLSLQITSAPATTATGKNISITTQLKNNGTVDFKQQTTFFFYVCPSTNPMSCYKDGYLMNVVGVPSLAISKGGHTNRSFTVPVLQRYTPGTWYIHVFIDAQQGASEFNESNNYTYRSIQLTAGVPVQPNLTLKTPSPARLSSLGANQTVRLTATLSNAGTGDAPAFEVWLYYTDSTASNLRYFKKYTYPSGLKAGQTLTIGGQIVLPGTVGFGGRYLMMMVDPTNKVQESSEQDNKLYIPLQVTGRPNLAASSITVSPNTAKPGVTIQLFYSILNKGYSRVTNGAWYASFYLSKDTKVDSGDILLKRVTFTTQLEVNKSISSNFSFVVPAGTITGTYQVLMWADSTNAVQEVGESDNVRATPFVVGGTGNIDLIPVSLVDTTPNQTRNQGLKSTVRTLALNIKNNGTIDSGPYTVALYATKSPRVIDSSSTFLADGNGTVTSHPGGVLRNRTFQFRIPYTLPAGYTYLTAVVDPGQKTKDINHANNLYSFRFLVTEDIDKDNFQWAPGCPSELKNCDCDDKNKTTYPNASESCDGKDNNCNGSVDENLTRSCYEGPTDTKNTGLCKEGTQLCTKGNWGACQNQIKPAAEVCDGKDNDCDGKTDETCSCSNGQIQPCGKSLGACQQGKQTCTGGTWGVCVGEVKPIKELCDGLDNDCDGIIDEDFSTKGTLCSVGKGECKRSGKLVCKPDATGVVCDVIEGKPGKEECDGLDNDCDGLIDNAPQCKSENPGDGGQEVVPETTPDTTGCSPSCGKNEYCWGGVCQKACGCKTCPSGQVCSLGTCVSNKCAVVDCQDGFVCIASTGACVANPCSTIQCPQGMQCRSGECVQTQCKPDEETSAEQNSDAAINNERLVYDFQLDLPPSSTPGCGCSVHEDASMSVWFLLLLGLAWIRRQRTGKRE